MQDIRIKPKEYTGLALLFPSEWADREEVPGRVWQHLEWRQAEYPHPTFVHGPRIVGCAENEIFYVSYTRKGLPQSMANLQELLTWLKDFATIMEDID